MTRSSTKTTSALQKDSNSTFKLNKSFLDSIFVVYFASHVPITLFIDAQAVIPQEFYHEKIRDLVKWYYTKYQDPFMNPALSPLWFRSLVVMELLLQLPLFLVLAFGIAFRKPWVRIPSMLYAVHVMTTLVPILGTLIFGEDQDMPSGVRPSLQNIFWLCSFYGPYFLIPFLLLVRMSFASVTEVPQKLNTKKLK